jgi:acetylserotonin N-methyltransferase
MIDLHQLPVADEAHDRAFLDLWIQDFGACAFSAADEVGLFVALVEGGRTAEQIAEVLRLEPDAVLAVCRALVALHGLTVCGGTFELTDFARAFWVKRTPAYRGREFDRHRDWEQHQRIVDTLEGRWAPIDDGERSFTAGWRDGDLDAGAAVRFTRVMHSMIFTPSLAAVRSGALAGVRHVLDVGGGSGVFAAAWIAHQPLARATVLDLPPVCEASRKILREVESGCRVEHHPGNFFRDPWPEDADAAWLSNVLHDWPLETCRELLRKVFSALPTGGRLFVHEALLEPDGCAPTFTAQFHLLMHMNHRGQQFTEASLFELLAEAGFRDLRVVHSYSYWSVVEGRRPE